MPEAISAAATRKQNNPGAVPEKISFAPWTPSPWSRNTPSDPRTNRAKPMAVSEKAPANATITMACLLLTSFMLATASMVADAGGKCGDDLLVRFSEGHPVSARGHDVGTERHIEGDDNDGREDYQHALALGQPLVEEGHDGLGRVEHFLLLEGDGRHGFGRQFGSC
jgi:hypothetical protein